MDRSEGTTPPTTARARSIYADIARIAAVLESAAEGDLRSRVRLDPAHPLAPVAADVDYPKLGKTFELSGGHIKNAVMRAAYMAAQKGAPIGQALLGNLAVIGRPTDLLRGLQTPLADEYILVPQAVPHERLEEITRLMMSRNGPTLRMAVSSRDRLTHGVQVTEARDHVVRSLRPQNAEPGCGLGPSPGLTEN